jgi:hypothetical protein
MKIHDFFNNIHYLSNDDLRLFEKFLISPYFNNLQYTSVVYRIILKNLTYISEEKYEELKSIIISETHYSETTVRKVLSYLNEMYIKFIKVQAYNKYGFQSELVYCNYLLLKGNYNLLNKGAHKIKKLLSEPENIDEDLFMKLFESDTLNYNILSTSEDVLNPITKLDKQKEFTNESSRNLMVYTLSKTTINYVNYVIQCSNAEENNTFPVNLENLFNVIFTSEYETYNNLQKSTINIFYKIYKLYSNISKDKYYDEYKIYFNEIRNLYNIEFCKTHSSILLGYCILRQRLSDKTLFYTTETLLILFDYIENGYYKNDKTEFLHPLMYRNYIVSCLNVNRKDVLLKFINTHTEKLNPSEIENMKKFGMAHYYYLEKNYIESINYSELIVNPKFLYKYDLYNLMIKNCFETDDYMKIGDILHNYNDYINADDFLTKYDKERYNFFVYCMKKYLIAYFKYETKQNIFDFEYLLKIISGKPNFVMKNWITKKITAFISDHCKRYNVKSPGY